MKSSSFCSPNVSCTTLSSRSTPSLNAKSHSFLLWGVACNLLSASVMLHVSWTSTVDIFITVIDVKKLLGYVARDFIKVNLSEANAFSVRATHSLRHVNRELKHRRRRRRGRRLEQNEFVFYQRNSRLSRSVRYTNGSKNVLRLNMQWRRSIPNGNAKN